MVGQHGTWRAPHARHGPCHDLQGLRSGGGLQAGRPWSETLLLAEHFWPAYQLQAFPGPDPGLHLDPPATVHVTTGVHHALPAVPASMQHLPDLALYSLPPSCCVCSLEAGGACLNQGPAGQALGSMMCTCAGAAGNSEMVLGDLPPPRGRCTTDQTPWCNCQSGYYPRDGQTADFSYSRWGHAHALLDPVTHLPYGCLRVLTQAMLPRRVTVHNASHLQVNLWLPGETLGQAATTHACLCAAGAVQLHPAPGRGRVLDRANRTRALHRSAGLAAWVRRSCLTVVGSINLSVAFRLCWVLCIPRPLQMVGAGAAGTSGHPCVSAALTQLQSLSLLYHHGNWLGTTCTYTFRVSDVSCSRDPLTHAVLQQVCCLGKCLHLRHLLPPLQWACQVGWPGRLQPA